MRSISFYLKSLRLYGIRGVIDYLLRLPQDFLSNRELIRGTQKNTAPIPGITLFASFLTEGSLSKVMRDFACNLKEAGIPYQTKDCSKERLVPHEDTQNLLTETQEFRFNRYNRTIDMFTMEHVRVHVPHVHHSHIAFWEFEDGFKEIHFNLFDGNTLIAFSDFCAQILRNESPPGTRIRKLRYPFRFEANGIPSSLEIRKKYNLQENDFVVFFNFDYGSSYYRKNPDGIVKSFATAFKDVEDVKLVFKTMGAKSQPEKAKELSRLAEESGIKNRFLTIDNYIPQKELYGLTNACDVYISLHRGEGFGLGVAEAMSLGKPVIVTDYSATTEFCKKDNAILIPYKLVPFDHARNNVSPYRFVSKCAEPDLDKAAEALRRCYDDRAFGKGLGKSAQAFISEYFSIENFKKSILDFMKTT